MTKNHHEDAVWHRSNYCATSGCLEVAVVAGSILLRNSVFPQQPPLKLTFAELEAFFKGVKAGTFDWIFDEG